MKKSYKSPVAKMIDYKYDEQVNASSQDTWYCFVQIYQGPTPASGCQNPNDWVGEQLYLTQELKLW